MDYYDGNWELGSPIDGMVIEFCTVLFAAFCTHRNKIGFLEQDLGGETKKPSHVN